MDIEEGPEQVELVGGPADEDTAALCAYVLSLGGLVIVPTDTVYGLAARAFDRLAVQRAFEVKCRDLRRKLPLLVAEPADLARYAREPAPCADELAARHWPGALTIVVHAAADLPRWLVDERETIAVRCPDHDLVRAVARRLGEPLAATSVNFSGRPEATRVADVPEEILESVDLVVDGGPTGMQVSTIVDCSEGRVVVVRRGAVDLPS